MTNENSSIPKNETFTWLEPGAWRKPCIVHGTGRGRCYGLLMELRAHEVQVAEVVEAEGATFGGLYT